MLLVIGGRYFTFQSLYGVRLYSLCGAALCFADIALALFRAPTAVSALSGAAIELAIGADLLAQVRRGTA